MSRWGRVQREVITSAYNSSILGEQDEIQRTLVHTLPRSIWVLPLPLPWSQNMTTLNGLWTRGRTSTLRRARRILKLRQVRRPETRLRISAEWRGRWEVDASVSDEPVALIKGEDPKTNLTILRIYRVNGSIVRSIRGIPKRSWSVSGAR